jgi:hypothetical protein
MTKKLAFGEYGGIVKIKDKPNEDHYMYRYRYYYWAYWEME